MLCPTRIGRRDAELLAEPGHVVGKTGDGVVLLRRHARPVPTQVHGDGAVLPAEVLDLRREVGVVARPAVDEHERRIAGARVLVGECGAVAVHVLHEAGVLHLGSAASEQGESPRASIRQ